MLKLVVCKNMAISLFFLKNMANIFFPKRILCRIHIAFFFSFFFWLHLVAQKKNPGSTWTVPTIFNVKLPNFIPQNEQERQGKQSGEKERARGAKVFNSKPCYLVRAHIEIIITHDLWLQVGQMWGIDRSWVGESTSEFVLFDTRFLVPNR
jgi:hypothetical protein